MEFGVVPIGSLQRNRLFSAWSLELKINNRNIRDEKMVDICEKIPSDNCISVIHQTK